MLGSRFRIAVAVIAAMIGETSRADVLHFIEGGEVDVPIAIEGAIVVLDTPMGKLRFPRTDFARIEDGFDPARDWPDRRSQALKGGADERLAAALWALDFGLVPESEAMLRDALAADPRRQPTARMVAVLDRLKTPLPDPEMSPLLRGAPPGHHIARGPHTLLIHEHSEAEAAERIATLERVVTTYYLYFASLGLELAEPQQKLPAIWYARKANYVAFLRAAGADAFLETRGYYHPTRGLVAAYDCRDDPPRVRARRAIASRRAELDRFSDEIARLRAGSRVRVALSGARPRELPRDGARALEAELRRQVDRQELSLELSRRQIDLAIAAHETIHQLIAASRLAPRHEAFPTWLHEGLAMQFEAVRGGRWSGLGSPPLLRLRDYRRLKSPPLLVPTSRDLGFGRGSQSHEDVYARAWSLVHYLRAERPSAFLALLDGLRLPSSGPESAGIRASRLLLPLLPPDSALEEARWHRHINALAPAVEDRSSPDHPD